MPKYCIKGKGNFTYLVLFYKGYYTYEGTGVTSIIYLNLIKFHEIYILSKKIGTLNFVL